VGDAVKRASVALLASVCLVILPGCGVVGAFGFGNRSTSCSPGRSMKFDDEFNDGLRQWTMIKGVWHQSQLETYTSKAVTVRNGKLVITATRSGGNYYSGRIDTQYGCHFTYGRVEARIKTPAGQGLWPAFWLVDPHDRYEIDVMEALGERPTYAYGSVHTPLSDSTHAVHERAGLADHWHTYGVIWNRRTITFTLDGRAYATVPSTVHTALYLTLNLAVGGAWPGDPNASTRFPAVMDVDWVRVYKLS
jgi:beta-glucanase (GH16 family)